MGSTNISEDENLTWNKSVNKIKTSGKNTE